MHPVPAVLPIGLPPRTVRLQPPSLSLSSSIPKGSLPSPRPPLSPDRTGDTTRRPNLLLSLLTCACVPISLGRYAYTHAHASSSCGHMHPSYRWQTDTWTQVCTCKRDTPDQPDARFFLSPVSQSLPPPAPAYSYDVHWPASSILPGCYVGLYFFPQGLGSSAARCRAAEDGAPRPREGLGRGRGRGRGHPIGTCMEGGFHQR